jgi:hypothetical protein
MDKFEGKELWSIFKSLTYFCLRTQDRQMRYATQVHSGMFHHLFFWNTCLNLSDLSHQIYVWRKRTEILFYLHLISLCSFPIFSTFFHLPSPTNFRSSIIFLFHLLFTFCSLFLPSPLCFFISFLSYAVFYLLLSSSSIFSCLIVILLPVLLFLLYILLPPSYRPLSRPFCPDQHDYAFSLWEG